MAGDHELKRLAQLLKLCADLAKSIAETRHHDSAQIRALSFQTSEIARRLEELVLRSQAMPDTAADALDRRH